MSFHQFLQKNLYIRYFLFIGTIFMGIYMVQAITQNASMDASIIAVDKQIEKTKRYTIFLDKIYKPYLESELATFVLNHEQWMLLPGEKIIRLDAVIHRERDASTKEKATTTIVTPLPLLAPPDAWHIFLQQLIEKNFFSTPLNP